MRMNKTYDLNPNEENGKIINYLDNTNWEQSPKIEEKVQATVDILDNKDKKECL